MTEMKKQHSLPRVRLMRRAAVIRRNNDMNRRDALIIAHRIGGLIRVAHVSCRKFPLRRMSSEEQMRFGEQMSFGQQISFGQQMNFGEQMTSEERKEWETLCRMYHVDSLYEAIQGCREELEFLVRCAERLEPRAEEE